MGLVVKFHMKLFFSDPKDQWDRQSHGKGGQIPAQEVSHRPYKVPLEFLAFSSDMQKMLKTDLFFPQK